MKARTTVTVLARTVETATVNTIPNVICCKIQVTLLGWPMKKTEHRKQNMREVSKMELRILLLAFTIRVSWCLTKTQSTTAVNAEKQKAIKARAIHEGSS